MSDFYKDAPLYNSLLRRADEGASRFHMPGHKGKEVFPSLLSGAQYIDFTELYGTGNLYDGIPPISDAEELAARLWGVADAFYLTGGATQGILTSLLLASRRCGKILLDRGCHKSVYNAISLFNLEYTSVSGNISEPFGIFSPISPETIDEALSHDPSVGAVVITSPTYYGVISDIEGISKACKKHGAMLIVDEAHGAHLPFHEGFHGATRLGATLSVCSLHKTLPALGQAALITSDGTIPPEEIRSASAVFGTSSPSYNIMASMDLAVAFMNRDGREKSRILEAKVSEIRETINSKSRFKALSDGALDPLRLTVCTACGGLCGYDAAGILERDFGIVCEMADMRNVLFIITVADEVCELSALLNSLLALSEKASGIEDTQEIPRIPTEARISPNKALLSKPVNLPLSDCAGKVSAATVSIYPPGIPLIAPGEVISDEHISHLLKNGFFEDSLIPVII